MTPVKDKSKPVVICVSKVNSKRVDSLIFFWFAKCTCGWIGKKFSEAVLGSFDKARKEGEAHESKKKQS